MILELQKHKKGGRAPPSNVSAIGKIAASKPDIGLSPDNLFWVIRTLPIFCYENWCHKFEKRRLLWFAVYAEWLIAEMLVIPTQSFRVPVNSMSSCTRERVRRGLEVEVTTFVTACLAERW